MAPTPHFIIINDFNAFNIILGFEITNLICEAESSNNILRLRTNMLTGIGNSL